MFCSCPAAHFHQRNTLPGMTSEAVRPPLRAGSQSRARAGYWVARSLKPGRSCLLEQYGHPVFLEPVRFITGEVYEWPRRHSQWTIFSLPADTSLGVSCALRAGSHSLEICGCVVARSLIPARTFRPLQMGHPCPALRLAMVFEIGRASCRERVGVVLGGGLW